MSNKRTITLLCKKCNKYHTIQYRSFKLRNITEEEYTCSKCTKSMTKNLIRQLPANVSKQVAWDNINDPNSIKATDKIPIICPNCQKTKYSQLNSLLNGKVNILCKSCKLSLKWKEGAFDHIDFRSLMLGREQDPSWQSKKENIDRSASRLYNLKKWSNDPDYRQRVLEAFRRAQQTDTYKEALKKGNKKKWSSQEYRDKMRRIYDSQEQKESCSLGAKKMWDIHGERLSKLYKTEEWKKKKSEISKALWDNPYYREKCTRNLRRLNAQMPKISGLAKQLYKLLEELNIKFKPDKIDDEYKNEFTLGPYAFDCMIPSSETATGKNILIEVQGDYWHNMKPNTNRDKSKRTFIERYYNNFTLKELWGHEFGNRSKIKSLLLKWIGIEKEISTIDYDFRSLKIGRISVEDANQFLNIYHYLSGVGRNGICIAAKFDDELAAVCSIASITRKETATRLGYEPKEMRELTRLAVSDKYRKKNLISYFLSRAIRLAKTILPKHVKLLVTFADTTYGHTGIAYQASNFIYDGDSQPSYWYVDNDGWIMHKKTLYNHAHKAHMKESEFAIAKGYTKINGKIKKRYIYYL